MKKSLIVGAKNLLVVAIAALAVSGCGSGLPAGSSAERPSSLALPTAAPTLVPSPVSTRVMPIEELTPAPTPTITPIPAETLGLVIQVLDGETIAVVLDGDPARLAYQVKYLGIDAPPNSPDNPWGIVAFETNRKLANLKVVKLVRDQTDFDGDGFMLRYVYVGNQLLNTELVRQGLARAAVTPPDTRFEDEILKAEVEAKADNLGLWNPNPPTPTPVSQPSPVPATVETAPRAAITATVAVTATLSLITTATTEPTAASTIEPTPEGTATTEPAAESTVTPAETIIPTVTITATSAGLSGPN